MTRDSGRNQTRPWITILRLVVTLATVTWVAWILSGAWTQFSTEVESVRLLPLLSGLVFGLAATFWGFIAFATIFSKFEGGALSWQRLAHFHFAAQLMKHLPGRFLGIAYQIALTRGSVDTPKWIAATGVYMALTLYFAIVLSLVVLVWPHSAWQACVIAVAGTSLCYLLWTPRFAHSIATTLGKSRFALVRAVASTAKSMAGVEHRSQVATIVVHLIISWALYFMAWMLYAAAYDGLSATDGLRICALYNVAWLAGYLSFISPSGFGVREAVFTALAASLGVGAIAYSILVGRFSLLLIDLVLGLIFLSRHDPDDRPISS